MAEPRLSPQKPEVDVQREQESAHGWLYAVVVRRGSVETQHSVTLDWRDHDYWCGGRLAPSAVIEAVVRYVLERWDGELPAKFDAAKARRWLPGIDQDLKQTL